MSLHSDEYDLVCRFHVEPFAHVRVAPTGEGRFRQSRGVRGQAENGTDAGPQALGILFTDERRNANRNRSLQNDPGIPDEALRLIHGGKELFLHIDDQQAASIVINQWHAQSSLSRISIYIKKIPDKFNVDEIRAC
ncbi:hypothetical protein CHELA1G11_20264 [Hyphomicrobiales bacterium]|nr:hypothetical protein CHELA1G11_20264 [Hyphomicrobiales bacterium]CAH1689353.1 hypothetical protein CHELA1G2_20579 [Hyphomicrobiales bacterium]